MKLNVAVLPIYRYRKNDYDIVVSTVSRGTEWQRELSPFLLGPCKLYDGHESRNLENAWQFSKVYKEHLNRCGEPSRVWKLWSRRGWQDPTGHRYPMGKGAVPEYSYWNGEHLGYIDARKQIYGPLYAEAVKETEAYRTLKQKAKHARLMGRRLVLLDFDAYDHAAAGLSLTDVLNNPRKKMGHAFVLAMLLLKDKALKQFKLAR